MTYKEIINRFRTITEDHLMLQDFGYGDLSDLKYVSQLGTDEERVSYPYLYLLPSSSNRDGVVMNYSFNMIVMDMARPEDGANTDKYDNYVTIQSQCQQYIDDVLAQLYYWYKDQPEIQLTGITYTPFKEKYQDVVAGMTATISIAVPTPLNECIAPFRNLLVDYSFNPTTVVEPDPSGQAIGTLPPTSRGTEYWHTNTEGYGPYNGLYMTQQGTWQIDIVGVVNQLEAKELGQAPTLNVYRIDSDGNYIGTVVNDLAATELNGWPQGSITPGEYTWNAQYDFTLPNVSPGAYFYFGWSHKGAIPTDESSIMMTSSSIKVYLDD